MKSFGLENIKDNLNVFLPLSVHRFCPVGKTFSKIFKATEFLAKLPVIAIHWAIGRRRRAWDREPDRVEETESRRNYGGTDDVSMSELEKSNT